MITQELNWGSPRWAQLHPDRQVYWTPGVVWRTPTAALWSLGLGMSFGLSEQADPRSVFFNLVHEFDSVRLF